MADTKITGISLMRKFQNGQPQAVVAIEVHGVWVEIIRESTDGPFSHIVEPGGIKRAIDFACEQQSVGDLVLSGGIVEAP